MSSVAVLGAGGGGLSATVELILAGHRVRLWNRNPATIQQIEATGEVRHEGVLGAGVVRPELITTDLAAAISSVDVIVVCLPSIVHAAIFKDLAALAITTPVVLNPGHTGGALHARHVWREAGAVLPPLVEFSTLTYVARVGADNTVNTTGRAAAVRASCLPGGQDALAWGLSLFPGATAVDDVLASSLSNVNLVLHPPGAILGLAWVEATQGDFTFYVDGMTPAVLRVVEALDTERRQVAAAFGHDLPSLLDEMATIGTVGADTAVHGDLGAAIRGGQANARIKAPDSTRHRYYSEDLPFGLLPFVELAKFTDQRVPTASALLALGGLALGEGALTGLDHTNLGLEHCTLTDLLAIVGRTSPERM